MDILQVSFSFRKGQEKFKYSGGHTKDDLVNWMKE